LARPIVAILSAADVNCREPIHLIWQDLAATRY
jgi:hypothetical protein